LKTKKYEVYADQQQLSFFFDSHSTQLEDIRRKNMINDIRIDNGAKKEKENIKVIFKIRLKYRKPQLQGISRKWLDEN
jgi:hypothetical protein